MLLSRFVSLAPLVLAMFVGMASCAEDEKATEEPVSADSMNQPAEPPVGDMAGFTPEAVYFAFDDYTLNSESQGRLNSLSSRLKGSQGTVVQIEGHCDERGSVEYNLALGQRRAESVKTYLVRMGIDAARLTTISYGEERPVASGHDEDSWSRNRRAEFVLSNQ